MEVRGAAIEAHHAAGGAVGIGQHARGDDAVGDLHAGALELAVQHLLDVVALRHRQHVRAHVVDLFHRVVAGLVLLEAHTPAVELLDGGEAVARIGVDGGLVDDAVVGHGDFAGVLLGRGVAGDHGVVQPVHAHRDRAAALDVGLVEQQHAQRGVALLGLDRGHRAGGAAADDNDVVFVSQGIHAEGFPLLAGLRGRAWPAGLVTLAAGAVLCRSARSRYWNASPRK
ncbi:hypothetical protein D3C72_1334160 [compost metagenome]